jgi:hypothetical protein
MSLGPGQIRKLVFALWAAPAFIACKLFLDAKNGPALVESWDVWLFFVFLPLLAGILLWFRDGRQAKRSATATRVNPVDGRR